MALFQPTEMFCGVERITPEYLAQKGIRGLILDVDNTLTGHGSQELPAQVDAWLRAVKAAGVRLVIASNNVEKRVAPFAQRLGVAHCAFCCKPAPWGLARARHILGLAKGEVALVGDQIFTDALGANLYGIPILLVQPMYEDTKPSIRLKRALEAPVLAHWRKKGGRIL